MAENLKEIKARLKAITEQIKASDSVSKKLQEELKTLRELSKEARNLGAWESKRLGDLNSIGKFDKAAVQQMQAKSNIGKSIGKLLVEQVKMNTAAVKGELDLNDVIKQKRSLKSQEMGLDKAAKKVGKDNETMTQAQIDGSRVHIATMRKGLDVAMDVNATAEKRGELADELTTKLNFFQKGWDDIKQKIGDAWSVVKANPIKSVIGLLTVGIMAVGKHLMGIVNSSVAMQKELGVGAGFAMDLELATREAAAGGFMYGENLEDVQTRASTLVDEWGVINEETKKSIGEATNLERLYGVSTTSAAQLAQMMESTSSSTKDVLLQDMGKEMKKMQKSGVPVGKIMEEVASDTDFFAGHMKDGGKNIIKAAAFAKKLGMSMSTISGASEKLLDFESSINAEMEASVLLGRNVNMERARQLAFTGDLEGMQKEIMKQVGSEAEFSRMNVVQREALAEAAGLSLTDLSKMVAAEEKLMTMSAEDLAQQKENQKVTNNIQKIWQAVVGVFQTLYQEFITPLGQKLLDILGVSGSMTGTFEMTEKAIAKFAGYLRPVFQFVEDIGMKFIGWIKELSKGEGIVANLKEDWEDWKKSIAAIWEKWKGWVITIGAVLIAIQLIGPALALIGTGGTAAGGALVGLSTGLKAMGTGAPLIAKGVLILVLAMAGFALGIYALSKAIEYGEKGFRIFFEVVGGFVLDVLRELIGLIVQLAPHVVNLASVVGGVLIDAFTIYKDLVIGIIEAISGLITGVFTSIYTTFEKFAAIGRDGGLFSAAAGIVAIGTALAGFGGGSAVGGILSSIGNFFGGDPVKKFQRFAALGPGLTTTAQAMKLLTDSMESFADLSIDNEVGSWFKGGVTKIQLVSDADKIRREVIVTDKRTSDKLDKVITLLEKQPTFESTQTNVKKTISSIEGAFANR